MNLSESTAPEPLLVVQDLQVEFKTSRGIAKAINGVSFSVDRGETLGLVGESGSGKSITCFSILQMISRPAGRIVGGVVKFEGEDLLRKSEKQMREIRGRGISMILQDPMTSLNPLLTVGRQIAESVLVKRPRLRDLHNVVVDLLKQVRIPAPEARKDEYPHQMSGGMRQRIVGAISIASKPSLLIADEPTTALDVTIQAQFLKLLKEMQVRDRLAMILVTHDLGLVAKNCDRVAVMYAGKIVEIGPVRDIFYRPSHPYTKGLLASLPKLGVKTDRLPSIEGQPPDLFDMPSGCSFSARCAYAEDICRREIPSQSKIGDGHYVSCWHENKTEHRA